MDRKADRAAEDRLALARQVIVSAGDILRAAGFSRAEIGAFLRQAAEQLAPGSERADEGSPPQDRGAGNAFVSGFGDCPPMRELAALARRADGKADPAELALRIVPHLAEAQDWLRSAAAEAGVEVWPNREAWQLASGNPPAAGPRDALCLDAFEGDYRESLLIIAAAIEQQAAQGDQEGFAGLLEAMFERGVIISRDIREAMERAAVALAPRAP